MNRYLYVVDYGKLRIEFLKKYIVRKEENQYEGSERMSYHEGLIISGEYDKEMNEFSIQKVKEFQTQSVVNQKQVNSLYQYLKSHIDEEEGQIVTLYDQMPVKLSQEEVRQIIQDLEQIQSLF
jgi:CRISPR/Cas system CSM-associated protein Csm2 small subunit